MSEAIGLIEVRGYLGAIVALDTALKAANVNFLKAEKISGGFSTVELSGDVAAVTAAVEVGKVAAESLGCLFSAHVIARADEQTEKLLKGDDNAEMGTEIVGEGKSTVVTETEEKPEPKQKEKKSNKEKNKPQRR